MTLLWSLAAAGVLALGLMTPKRRQYVWLEAGILAALVTSLANINWLLQLATLAAVALTAAVVLSWPEKKKPVPKSAASPLLGQPGLVTKDIPKGGLGEVKVLGAVWEAADIRQAGIARGELVSVRAVRGNKLAVEAKEKPSRMRKYRRAAEERK